MAEPRGRMAAGPVLRLIAGAACVGLAIVLASAWGSLPETGSRLAGLVEERLAETGVTSRVTAVLLGFRGYDTLLEVTVLLVAAAAVRGVAAGARTEPVHIRGPAVAALLRLIAPLGILLSAYVVWRGGHAAGGAFQAAAMLGGGVIALALGGIPLLRHVRPGALRALLAFGPAAFLAVAVAGALAGGAFLRIPGRIGGATITGIEVALTLSLGLALVLLLGETLPAPRPDGIAGPDGEGEEEAEEDGPS